ncbi:MAG: extracellular solute-binding protein, partial [Anaerolineae bacterium]|nr:extracellular solute-binding protein [Anaerolineae bacterium]
MKQRVLLILLLAAALGLNSIGNLSAQDNVVEIEFSFPIAVDAPITETINQYIADFEAANPDIKVTPVFSGGYTDAMTAIMTTIDGGGEPPAVAVLLATALYDLINADAIAPLTPYINEMGEGYLDGFYPAFLSNSYYGDDVWSMPFQRSAVILYYNADLLKAEGIAVPNSWESLAAAAEALTVRDGDNVTRWGIEWSSD